MSMELIVLFGVLPGLLGIAVVSDLRRHRIPNVLVLLGIVIGLGSQVLSVGFSGLNFGLMGMLTGFAIFLPLYIFGGMAAGDVKLMAMVGSFFLYEHAMWIAFYSLIAGGVFGCLIVLFRGQLMQTLTRYGLMLKVWAYLAPVPGEVAGKPFPYSVAILVGTLTGIFWHPFGL